MAKLIIVIALALLIAACGGGTAAKEQPTKDALTAIVSQEWEWVADGDARALYDRMSARCRAEKSYGDSASDLQVALAMFRATYGEPGDFTLQMQSFDEFAPPRAVITYSVVARDDASLVVSTDTEPWVYEDGLWRRDDCP